MAKKLEFSDRKILLNALADAPDLATARERQTFVREALDGYPAYSEIKKALQWVHWEKSNIVFGDDLLLRLETQEPAPDVPALALIAQAIERMAGAEHQEKVADLRRRMGWGDFDPSLSPAQEWRDQRPPVEVALERIIGENTLRPLYYLRRALIAADAVVRIDVAGSSGTGFLVAPDLMMTNHHVIASEREARIAKAYFFDEEADVQNDRDVPRKEQLVCTDPNEPLLYTSKRLDVTLVRLKGSPPLEHYLPLKPALVRESQRVVIIQHPGGAAKHISLQNNLVAFADERLVQYYTSTQQGSSGSPVLDDDFAVVAVHHSVVPASNAPGQVRGAKNIEDSQFRNQGTSMIAFLEDLRNTKPNLVNELTIVVERK